MMDCDQRLRNQAMTWKTPHGMSGMDASGKRGGPGGGEFAKQANNWPTPQANEIENPNKEYRNPTNAYRGGAKGSTDAE
jgi:hypothetical protein